jgi:hypothetical protein
VIIHLLDRLQAAYDEELHVTKALIDSLLPVHRHKIMLHVVQQPFAPRRDTE